MKMLRELNESKLRRSDDMTISGRIRSLRMALRKAEHPNVDLYDATYLRYVAETMGDIDSAVKELFKIDGKKRKE